MQKTNTGSWNDDSNWIEKNDLEGYDSYQGSFSDFWMPRMPEKKGESDIQKLVRLSHVQKSIGNFVRILTGRSNINVRFHTKSASFTDGKTVTISSNVSDKNYDTSVGLALHESSHCVYTDFNLFAHPESFIPKPVYDRAQKLKYERSETIGTIRSLFNWIEDRRIDNLTYHSHPGYKGYYASLYNEYFRCKEITELLKSSEYREETIKSYETRIINLMNENSDLDALRGLRAIYKLIDLKNIGRLRSSRDSFDVAVKVFDTMLDYIEIKKKPIKVKMKLSKEQKKNMQKSMGSGAQPDVIIEDDSDEDDDMGMGSGVGEDDEEEKESKSGSKSDDEKESKDSDKSDDKTDEKTEDEKDEKGAEAADLDDEENSPEDFNEDEVTEGEGPLSDKMKSKVEKALEEIQDLLNNTVDKSALKDKDAKNLDMIEKSGTTIQDVTVNGTDHYTGKPTDTIWNVPVTVIRKVTHEFFDSSLCQFSSKGRGWGDKGGSYKSYVERGVVLGKMLGRKLQIRNEIKIQRDIRKDHGKVDRRLLSSVSYGYENIFYRQNEDKYAKAILHLSIDSSGSMGGQKMGQAIQTAVAIAKFCDMNPSLHCVVSLRSAETDVPWIAIVYDSRVDKFTKVLSMFPYLTDSGSTPEGLCFAAIQKEIESTSGELTSYFVNLSDGSPTHYYKSCHYSGYVATGHTKRTVENMRQRGIIVLSYLIGGYYDGEFREMYGKSAAMIDVDQITQLAHSLEKMFLEKPKN